MTLFKCENIHGSRVLPNYMKTCLIGQGYVGFVPSDRGAFFVDRSVTEHHFQKPILDFLYHRFHLIIEIKKERILFKLHADTITHKVDQGSDLVKAETQSLQKILLSKRVYLNRVLEPRSKSFKP